MKISRVGIILLLIFLVGCKNEEKNDSQSLWVYDTNQYQAYKRMSALIHNSDRNNAKFIGEVSESEKNYWKYEIEDISVLIEETNPTDTVYSVFQENMNILDFTISNQGNPYGVTISYVDITEDGSKDIVFVGEPPGGTVPNPYWVYAYNLKNNCELKIFTDFGELTKEQTSQLEVLLDEKFYKIFPNYEVVDCTGGHQCVDEFGNLYYILPIWNGDYYQTVGEMIVFLNYNINTGLFDVSDLMYMPEYVYE